MLQFIQTPKENDIDEIENSLRNELADEGFSFITNINIIYDSFKEKNLFVLRYNNKCIGFLAFQERYKYVSMNIMNIDYKLRGQGYGKYLFNNSIPFFIDNDCYSAELFCDPPESELFWRSNGFLKYPNTPYSKSKNYFYKPIIDYLKPNQNIKAENSIELWDSEIWYIKKTQKPKWVWQFNLENDVKTLKKPIVIPCYKKWKIRLNVKGNISEGTISEIFSTNEETYENSYLTIFDI